MVRVITHSARGEGHRGLVIVLHELCAGPGHRFLLLPPSSLMRARLYVFEKEMGLVGLGAEGVYVGEISVGGRWLLSGKPTELPWMSTTTTQWPNKNRRATKAAGFCRSPEKKKGGPKK